MSGTGNGRLNVFAVRTFERENRSNGTSWTKVGVAFPHRDGIGFNIELEAFPRDGRLVVLPPRDDSRNGDAHPE